MLDMEDDTFCIFDNEVEAKIFQEVHVAPRLALPMQKGEQ